jgi:hypothetical protein
VQQWGGGTAGSLARDSTDAAKADDNLENGFFDVAGRVL